VERLQIEQTQNGARYTEDDGKTWIDLPAGTLVSMNFWGFEPGLLDLAKRDFPAFLDGNLPKNPEKCEFLLPNYVGQMIGKGEADVKVLQSGERWFGVTYKEDKPGVVQAIAEKHKAGLYPTPLWSNM
jgi:hypothetical protein